MEKTKDETRSRADAALIVSSSEEDADLLYATRFFAPDPFIFFSHRGKKFLIVSNLEIDRARREASVDGVLSLSQLQKRLSATGKSVEMASVLSLVFSQKNIRSVLVPYRFPLGLAVSLKKRGVRVVHTSAGAFFEQRERKSSLEVREIERVQKTAEECMRAAIGVIRASTIRKDDFLFWRGRKLGAETVKQRIGEVALTFGCKADHVIVACGKQGAEPHNEGSGFLRANASIIIDIFPRSRESGYWGDLTRTVVRGKASVLLRGMFEAVREAQESALQRIKNGARCDAVHRSVEKVFVNRGFLTGTVKGKMQGFFHGTGHGVGLEIHEAPHISPGSKEVLRAGHVVTMEPGLYYPNIGGVRLEDLVVVTASGHRNLTTLPKYLEV